MSRLFSPQPLAAPICVLTLLSLGIGECKRGASPVVMTSPADGTVYTEPTRVTLAVNVDALLEAYPALFSHVDFTKDGELLFRDEEAPFEHDWAIAQADNGTHTLRAQAFAADPESSDVFALDFDEASVRVAIAPVRTQAPPGTPDEDTEQRCKDIDAMGGANACRCSEPLITNETIETYSGGWWDPAGSVSKPCGGGSPEALYLSNWTNEMRTPSGWYDVPDGSGISYVYVGRLDGNGNNGFNGYYSEGANSVPTDVGRTCHRAVVAYSQDWSGKNGDNEALDCTRRKLAEFNPNPQFVGNQSFGQQWQHSSDTGKMTAGWSAPNYGFTGSASFSNTGESWNPDVDCKNGRWCAYEMCWFGDFSTGYISPIAHSWSIDGESGAVLKSKLHEFAGTRTPGTNFDVPVTFQIDWLLNLYTQGNSASCGGETAIVYGMSADFAVADDGTREHGPWIGPPRELTGAP